MRSLRHTFAALVLCAGFLGCSSAEGLDSELEPQPQPGSSVDAGSGAAEPCTPENVPKTLRLMSYNIKHGEVSGITELGNVLKNYRPSIVSLQEVDYETNRSGNRNQAYDLGQRTGMGATLRTAKAVDGGNQANAALFNYPMLNNERVDLPQVDDEERVLLIVTIELAPNFPVTLGVVHLAIRATDRAQQVPAIIAAMEGRPNPVIIGDFNEKPDGPNIALMKTKFRDAWQLAGDGEGATFPAINPESRIDYIFLGDGWPDPIRAEVGESGASDHRPLFVEVPMPAAMEESP